MSGHMFPVAHLNPPRHRSVQLYLTEYPRASMQAEKARLNVLIC